MDDDGTNLDYSDAGPCHGCGEYECDGTCHDEDEDDELYEDEIDQQDFLADN